MSIRTNNAYLIIQGLNNTQRGKTYHVHQPITVGRSNNCDIFIMELLMWVCPKNLCAQGPLEVVPIKFDGA